MRRVSPIFALLAIIALTWPNFVLAFCSPDCKLPDSYCSDNNICLAKTNRECSEDSKCKEGEAFPQNKCLAPRQLPDEDKFCYATGESVDKINSQSDSDIPVASYVFTSIEKDLQVRKPLLEINIPGLNLSDVQSQIDQDGYLHLPWIGEYLAGIYKFGMIAASIAAVIVIIMQGVKIVVSGGGEEKNSAYKRIAQAVIGVVLLWGSYAILYNINPDLVNFRALKVKYIQPSEWDGVADSSLSASTSTERCGGLAGNTQELASDVGLRGDFYKYSLYSTKYGPTCKKSKPTTTKGIILHWTGKVPDGSPQTVLSWWGDENAKLGAICQVIVARDGLAYQVTNSLVEQVVCQGASTGYGWNKAGIGIEIIGTSEEELLGNTAQKQGVINLVKALMGKFGIPATNAVANLMDGTGGIFSHKQISECQKAKNKKIDPSENYMKEIIKAVGGTYTDWTSDPACK